MRNATIISVIGFGLVVAGAVYLKDRPEKDRAESSASVPLQAGSSEQVAESFETDADEQAGVPSMFDDDAARLDSTRRDDAAYEAPPDPPAPAPYDPRLAALEVSPDNGWINYVTGSDGKVTMEIDMDPASPGYKKPTRKYTYSGDRVTELIAYRYFYDHVQITTTTVSYNPDGSIADYSESTSYDYGDEASDGS